MKFKKIVSVILSCALITNFSVVSLALTEEEANLTIKVNNLERQLIKSEAEKNVLKSKIKNAELNNQKAFEDNIEELKKQNKKLKKAIAANSASGTISWLGSFLGIFDILLKMGVLVTFGSLYLAAKFEKPIKKTLSLKTPEDLCPTFFVPFRDYGKTLVSMMVFVILKILKNENVKKELNVIFKGAKCIHERNDL